MGFMLNAHASFSVKASFSSVTQTTKNALAIESQKHDYDYVQRGSHLSSWSS